MAAVVTNLMVVSDCLRHEGDLVGFDLLGGDHFVKLARALSHVGVLLVILDTSPPWTIFTRPELLRCHARWCVDFIELGHA